MNERIGFMCKKDFDYHLENDARPQLIYPDFETLQTERPCIQHCGAVKVKITIEEVVSDPQVIDYGHMFK